MADRWYPKREHFQSHEQWNAHREAFNKIYQLQDQLDRRHKELDGKISSLGKAQMPNGPSNTKIQGLNVGGTPPQNGQKLTYNAATGQIEWQ